MCVCATKYNKSFNSITFCFKTVYLLVFVRSYVMWNEKEPTKINWTENNKKKLQKYQKFSASPYRRRIIQYRQLLVFYTMHTYNAHLQCTSQAWALQIYRRALYIEMNRKKIHFYMFTTELTFTVFFHFVFLYKKSNKTAPYYLCLRSTNGLIFLNWRAFLFILK